MRIVLREHVLEVIAAFPFRWRRLVVRSRDERIWRNRPGSSHQVRNVARAVWKNLAGDAYHDLRPVMPAQRHSAVVDHCLAADTRAERFAVEAHEQQPDIRVAMDVAER